MSKCIYTQEQFDKILEERNELANENFKLKQQLAEKEKEIEELKYELEWAKNDVNESAVGHKQWVIEELEKIKYKFREVYDKKRKHYLSVVKCYELVDEQIEQLIHQHEDKGE